MISIPVVTFDETLSTKEAQILSKEAGIGQKKRHQMEDAYAATIMLQNFLDFN
jgi:putative Holliday junction resolvase